jgi:DNA-binding CsgD family transcriptional regulator
VSALHLYQEVSREGKLGEDAVYSVQRKAELPIFEGLYSGFINISQDGDGMLRRTVLSRSFEGKLYHSLAFETYRLLDKSNLQNWYARNPELNRSYLLNYCGPDRTFSRLSAISLLGQESGEPGGTLKDKIVLIGPVFKASKDFQASSWLTWLSFLVLGALAFFLTFYHWNARKQLAIFFSVWALGGALSLTIFLIFRVYLPPAFPLLSSLILFGALFITQKITARQGLRVEMGQLGAHGIQMLDIFCGRYEITRREKEFLPLLARQLSNPELAAKLFVSINTVKTHVASIYKKTGVNSREELAEMLSELQKPS